MRAPPPLRPSDAQAPNITRYERAHIDTDGHRLLTINAPFRELFDPDECPEEMLDILAYTWSVDEWEPDWPVERKREAIKLAPAMHRVKGTRGALDRAIAALGYQGLEISEWFDYGGEPYRFKLTLDITDRPFGLSDYHIIVRAALRAKNVRSHLEALATRLRYVIVGPYIGGAHVAVVRARVLPARPPRLPARYALGHGALLMPVRITARVNPLTT